MLCVFQYAYKHAVYGDYMCMNARSSNPCTSHLGRLCWSQESVFVNYVGQSTGYHNCLAKLGGLVVVCFGGSPVLRAYREVQSVGFGPICRLLCKGASTRRLMEDVCYEAVQAHKLIALCVMPRL